MINKEMKVSFTLHAMEEIKKQGETTMKISNKKIEIY